MQSHGILILLGKKLHPILGFYYVIQSTLHLLIPTDNTCPNPTVYSLRTYRLHSGSLCNRAHTGSGRSPTARYSAPWPHRLVHPCSHSSHQSESSLGHCWRTQRDNQGHRAGAEREERQGGWRNEGETEGGWVGERERGRKRDVGGERRERKKEKESKKIKAREKWIREREWWPEVFSLTSIMHNTSLSEA